MNFGTKIRTAIAVIALINQALVTIGPVDFGNEISNQIYRWVSLIFLVGAMASSHWYNNDFTEEACVGTGVTRQLKAEQGKDYIGDIFFEDEDPDDEELMEDE